MKSILYVIGLIMLGKGGYDFYDAIFGKTTFEEVSNIDIQFEVAYYIFGIAFGYVCKCTKDDAFLKGFAGVVGFVCLIISGFLLFDYSDEPARSTYDCTSSPDVDLCIHELLPKN